MKSLFNLFVLSFLLFAFTGCTKEDVSEEASISFIFDHVVDDKGLENGGPMANPNAAGNNYNTTTFRYIISNFVLIDQSGNEIEYDNYDIIDAFGGNTLDPRVVPNGTYEKIRFTLGVADPENTSTGPLGDLTYGGDMHFGGSDGYIFLKHEGNFLNSSNEAKTFSHHFGKTGNQVTFDIPAGGLKINGVNKTAYVICNLNALYAAPAIDFNAGPIQTSDDPAWTGAMKANLPNAFTFYGSYEDK